LIPDTNINNRPTLVDAPGESQIFAAHGFCALILRPPWPEQNRATGLLAWRNRTSGQEEEEEELVLQLLGEEERGRGAEEVGRIFFLGCKVPWFFRFLNLLLYSLQPEGRSLMIDLWSRNCVKQALAGVVSVEFYSQGSQKLVLLLEDIRSG
jgi:hypothetical protein